MAGGFDTSGFVLPENNFGGLYKIGEEMAQQRQRQQALALKQHAQQMLGEKYIGNQLNNKALFTGTPYDPVHNDLLNEARTQATELFKNGAELGDVQMAITPLINRMTDYQTNAKDFQLKQKEALPLISKRDDINKDEYLKTVQNMAFPIDKNTGKPDLTQYDPNRNYWDEALNSGDNIFNSNGVKKWFQSFKPQTDNNVYKYTAPNGTSTYNRNSLSYPSFMQPIEDPVKGFLGFEPKHEIATDEGNIVLHQFGEQKGQPVKLLSQDVWDAMPTDNKAYYVQQVRNHIAQTGSKTPLDSQQAENYARALAYDDAKTFGQSNTKTNFNNQQNNFDRYAFADYNNRLKKYLYDYTQTGGNTLPNGNLFKLFGVGSPIPLQSGGQIIDGVVYDKDGNIQKGGQKVIERGALPAEFTNVVQQGGKLQVPKFVTVDLNDDGTIKSAHLPSGILDVQQLSDLQDQMQTKGKSPKKTFGGTKPTISPTNTTTIKKVVIKGL